jgi:hypothetical protein
MAMGRAADRQGDLMVSWGEMPRSPAPPYERQNKDTFGARWAGENEALDRLLLGATSAMS